jgi:RimJ/RimL family protein N-acetyltransferase
MVRNHKALCGERLATYDAEMILNTARLRLEPYQDGHLSGLLAMNSDPVVMRFIGGTDTEDDVRAQITRVRERWAKLGYSWWAFISQETEQLVGAGCIQNIEWKEANPIEVGWRLRPEHWGKGFATEAGQAMLRFAFEHLKVPEVYGVADPENHASLRVMQRLGMRDAGPQPFYGTVCSTYVKERG